MKAYEKTPRVSHNEKRVPRSRDARFDEDGESIDDGKNEFADLDRFLATQPGTEEARRELGIE